MRDFITITKALADEGRVRILMALTQGELCLCQLVEFLELAPSTVSKHISILSQARLVNIRKDGRWHYYSLAAAGDDPLAASAVEWIVEALNGSQPIKDDRKRVRQILCMNKEDCCTHYR